MTQLLALPGDATVCGDSLAWPVARVYLTRVGERSTSVIVGDGWLDVKEEDAGFLADERLVRP